MPEREGPRIFGQHYLEEQTLNYIQLTQEEISRRNQIMLQRNRTALETHSQRIASQPNTASEVQDQESQSDESDSDDDVAEIENLLDNGTPDSNVLLVRQLREEVLEATSIIKAVRNLKFEVVVPHEQTFLRHEEGSTFNSSVNVNHALVPVPLPTTEEVEGPKKFFTAKIVDWLTCMVQNQPNIAFRIPRSQFLLMPTK